MDKKYFKLLIFTSLLLLSSIPLSAAKPVVGKCIANGPNECYSDDEKPGYTLIYCRPNENMHCTAR